MRHTFQEKTRQTPTRLAETIQQRNQPDPLCYRTIHSPPESMANTIHPLPSPPTHNHPGNQRDTEDNVLPTTNRTPFPQRLNKLLGRRDVPRETTPTFRSHQTYVSRETLKSFQESTNPNGKPLAIQHSPIRTQHTHLLKQTVWILKIYGIRSSIFYKHDHRREGFHYRHYLSTWNSHLQQEKLKPKTPPYNKNNQRFT